MVSAGFDGEDETEAVVFGELEGLEPEELGDGGFESLLGLGEGVGGKVLGRGLGSFERGFAAEFVTFIGSFSSTVVSGIQVYTLLGVFGIVITAGYILWMLQRVFYGEPRTKFDNVGDADTREKLTIFSLVAVILAVGIYPSFLTDIIKAGLGPVVKLIGG